MRCKIDMNRDLDFQSGRKSLQWRDANEMENAFFGRQYEKRNKFILFLFNIHKRQNLDLTIEANFEFRFIMM